MGGRYKTENGALRVKVHFKVRRNKDRGWYTKGESTCTQRLKGTKTEDGTLRVEGTRAEDKYSKGVGVHYG